MIENDGTKEKELTKLSWCTDQILFLDEQRKDTLWLCSKLAGLNLINSNWNRVKPLILRNLQNKLKCNRFCPVPNDLLPVRKLDNDSIFTEGK